MHIHVPAHKDPCEYSFFVDRMVDDEIPKLPIYAFIGLVFIGAPLMPVQKGGGLFGKIVHSIYLRVGAGGLLALPFGTLTLEKSLYDTYCAFHGQSIYEEGITDKHGGFPSGGAALPSFSVLKTRAPEDRASFRLEALDRDTRRDILRRHDDHRTGEGNCIYQADRGVAGAGGHVHQ